MMAESPTTPTCAFHGAKKVVLSREGETYRCGDCGWRGDVAAMLMQIEGIGMRDAILGTRRGGEGPSS